MNFRERREIIAKSTITQSHLRKMNTAAGVLHLVQGLVMLYLGLSLEWTRDVYTFYINFNIISIDPPVFEVGPLPQIWITLTSIGAILASFPLMSSIAHFSIVTLKQSSYWENLQKGKNPYRWYEYALSSSVIDSSNHFPDGNS